MHDARVQEIARAISEMGNQVVICGVRSKDGPERPQQIGKDLTLDYIEQPTKDYNIQDSIAFLSCRKLNVLVDSIVSPFLDHHTRIVYIDD